MNNQLTYFDTLEKKLKDFLIKVKEEDVNLKNLNEYRITHLQPTSNEYFDFVKHNDYYSKKSQGKIYVPSDKLFINKSIEEQYINGELIALGILSGGNLEKTVTDIDTMKNCNNRFEKSSFMHDIVSAKSQYGSIIANTEAHKVFADKLQISQQMVYDENFKIGYESIYAIIKKTV